MLAFSIVPLTNFPLKAPRRGQIGQTWNFCCSFFLPVAGFLIVVPIIALVRTGNLGVEIKELRSALKSLRGDVDALIKEPAAPAPDPRPAEFATPPSPPSEPPPAEAEEPEVVDEEEAEPEAPATAPSSPPPPAATEESLESRLTLRWLVWLGGVTIAFGGVFLVRYSIDAGLLGPKVRCTLGVLLGIALVAGGEWLRRQPLQRAVASISPSHVPPALTAAGLASMYASIYAAFALYGLLPALAAFGLLAAVTAMAFGLSLLQGPFIAIIGLLGGFLVPLLVSTDQPSALALFPYLLILVVGSLAVVRYMAWSGLTWLALHGATAWVLIWLVTAWRPGDTAVLCIYLLLAFGAFVFIRWRPPDSGTDITAPDWVALVAAIAVAALMFIVIRVDGYTTVSLAALIALCAAYMAVGRREGVFDLMAVLAVALMAATLATWHLPRVLEEEGLVLSILGQRTWAEAGPHLPPALIPFATVSLILGALFAIGGFAALWGARRPSLWAAVSIGAPVAILTIAYWRVEPHGVDLGWSAIGLGIGLAGIAAAQRVIHYRRGPGLDAALGAYAIGIVAATSLAATMALEEAWLTVALALQLPALGWIYQRLEVASLRRVAMVVAAVVLTRLTLNFELLNYPAGAIPGLGWVLYGYAIPLACFLLAARWFQPSGDNRLIVLLESGALVFGVLLVSLEIREIVAGSIDSPEYGFLERSLQSIAWLATGYGLYRRSRASDSPVLLWGFRLLAAGATAHVALFQVLGGNPIRTGDPVGDWPLINLLLLGYGIPGILGVLFLREAIRQNARTIATIAGSSALLLFLVEVSLEVRHAFHGGVLAGGGTSDAEWYSYSAAWIVYAGVLLALGILRGHAILRYASLAVLMLTVGKVFPFDMAALTGLYRAVSFLGLGASLVAIGWLYQRFVFPRPAAAPPASPPASPA